MDDTSQAVWRHANVCGNMIFTLSVSVSRTGWKLNNTGTSVHTALSRKCNLIYGELSL